MQRHNVQLSHCSTRHSGGGSGVLVHLRRPKGLHQVEVTASSVRENGRHRHLCRFWRGRNKRLWTACFRSHRLATFNVDVDVTDCLSWSTIVQTPAPTRRGASSDVNDDVASARPSSPPRYGGRLLRHARDHPGCLFALVIQKVTTYTQGSTLYRHYIRLVRCLALVHQK
jgi:hypothetical protein